ncbi:hypothetical protein M422DRAFT_43193 [Sphaerobolus stellatus SS14]|nr:hypothetical protein M422DRAFT_43193 [Sphaerobolus stellatus SS14]
MVKPNRQYELCESAMDTNQKVKKVMKKEYLYLDENGKVVPEEDIEMQVDTASKMESDPAYVVSRDDDESSCSETDEEEPSEFEQEILVSNAECKTEPEKKKTLKKV